MRIRTDRNRGVRWLCLWMALVLLAACALGGGTAAVAERRGIPELDIQWAAVREGGNIDMLLYSRSNNLKAIDLALSAGDIDIPIDTVEPFVGGTTWVILVDSANVNTSDGTEPIRATIKNLLESMRNEDNGVILSIADALRGINLRAKQQLMSAEPPVIKKDTQERRLFEAIDRALTFLETADGVCEHAVLTVITNGKNLYEAAVSSNNLIQRISNEPVTVYTVVYGTENAKNAPSMSTLHRMAELSCGGISVFDRPDAGDPGAARVVSTIRSNEAHFFRARAHVPASGASGSELRLRTASGGNETNWTLAEDDKGRLAGSGDEASESAEEHGDEQNQDRPAEGDKEKSDESGDEASESAEEHGDEQNQDHPAEGESEKKNEDGRSEGEGEKKEEEDPVEIEKKRPEVTDSPTEKPTATAKATESPTATAAATESPTATADTKDAATTTTEDTSTTEDTTATEDTSTTEDTTATEASATTEESTATEASATTEESTATDASAATDDSATTEESTSGLQGIFTWPPSNWKGYLAYGLIALAVLIAIILIIVKLTKKKKAPEEDTDQFSKTQVRTSPADVRDMGYGRPDDRVRPRYDNDEINVTLVDVDNPRNRYSAYMRQNELSIGRGGVDDRGRPVTIDLRIDTDDAKLSRKHAVFQMKDGRMMVNDCSTNGIYIGDSTRRIDMPTEIHQKTILRMGNARFMVTWTMGSAPYNQGGR